MARHPSATEKEHSHDPRHKRERLIAIIRRQSLLQNRDFVLVSGRTSNFFFDMKRTMFDPEGAALLADLLFDAINAEDVENSGGLETGAIPIVTALCARSWPENPLKVFFVRKENKGHGTDQRIDGLLQTGAKVILFEDVTTTGGSAMQAVNKAGKLDCPGLRVAPAFDRLE